MAKGKYQKHRRNIGGWILILVLLALVITMGSIYFSLDPNRKDPAETTTQPTATAAGEKTRTCKDCGSTETASVSKLSGSAAQNGTTGTTPGGTTSSTTTGGSTTCNHNFILTSSIAATCETGSTSVYTCNQCGATKTETGEAIGHIFGDWYISLPPTATEDGMQEKTCYRCGKKETQTLAKTPEKHICSYLPEIVRQPSCTATGTKKYTCTICHYYYTTIIPATGHLDTNGDNKCDKCRTAM